MQGREVPYERAAHIYRRQSRGDASRINRAAGKNRMTAQPLTVSQANINLGKERPSSG
jgi:hypothetical protein